MLDHLPAASLRRLELELGFLSRTRPNGENVGPLPFARFCTAGLEELVLIGFTGSYPRLSAPQLRKVALWGCKITDRLLEDLGEYRDGLVGVTLECARDTDYDFMSIGGHLPRLRTLYMINQTTFGDAGLALAANSRLETLHASGTSITDQGLFSSRSGLVNLRTLLLFGTALGDAGLSTIVGHCPLLVHLDARMTHVTCAGIAVVGRHLRLEHVSIGFRGSTMEAGRACLASLLATRATVMDVMAADEPRVVMALHLGLNFPLTTDLTRQCVQYYVRRALH